MLKQGAWSQRGGCVCVCVCVCMCVCVCVCVCCGLKQRCWWLARSLVDTQALLEQADADGDGTVTREEFRDFYSKHSAKVGSLLIVR